MRLVVTQLSSDCDGSSPSVATNFRPVVKMAKAPRSDRGDLWVRLPPGRPVRDVCLTAGRLPLKQRVEFDMAYRNMESQRRCWREWYHRNKDEVARRVEGRRRATRQWLVEYKSHLRCARCPETDPACLDFHHRDGNEKEISVACALSAGWTINRLIAEIDKCEVLCANCHRKHHAAESFKQAGRRPLKADVAGSNPASASN